MNSRAFLLAAVTVFSLIAGACGGAGTPAKKAATSVPAPPAPVPSIENSERKPDADKGKPSVTVPPERKFDGDVAMTIRTVYEKDGRVHFEGTTNLPERTTILVSVRNPSSGYHGQAICTVAEGTIQTEAFGSAGGRGLKDGSYIATFTMNPQPEGA